LNGDADGGSINPGTLSGKGPMTHTLVLNSGARMSPAANALTFTPAIVASDLIFRDGMEP
jgi:hypothetical protein